MGSVRSTGRAALATALIATAGLTACSTSLAAADSGAIRVAASINVWGSVLAQLGGTHVRETSIITNPNTDPHDYEPTTADARTVTDARLFVENGAGYDSWAAKSLAASSDSSRKVIDVCALVHVPDGGNPHRWYSPADVEAAANAIAADLSKLDPADAGYFEQRRTAFLTSGLAQYHRLISEIKTKYAGTPVGASESIFAPLSAALGLRLLTPPSFLKAISEGADPSPRDKATIDAQLAHRRIKVYVYNSQNATPDVAAQVKAARAAGIPVTAITETVSPAGASFQQWQSAQLESLARALAEASNR